MPLFGISKYIMHHEVILNAKQFHKDLDLKCNRPKTSAQTIATSILKPLATTGRKNKPSSPGASKITQGFFLKKFANFLCLLSTSLFKNFSFLKKENRYMKEILMQK